ncbi:MAG: type IV pili methyl-accepting chemotaxis transducer N-terminal domain-containing protein [Pseudomonadota bacterium]
MSLLITCHDSPQALADAHAMLARLQAAGLQAFGPQPCHMLVREVVRLAPQAVLVLAPVLDDVLRQALGLLATSAACPVLVAGAALPAADLPALLDLNLVAWLPADVQPAALVAAQALAIARFQRDQAQQQALAVALARLDERKWVDKAKGLLMRAQQLSEDDAFTLLRTASMQANLRVGEVSRGLLEAAQSAEAINRAGQLRMLSQRHVKALALRAVARGRVEDTLADTAQRLQHNLDWLAKLALPAPMAGQLEACRQAWLALQPSAAGGQTRGTAWPAQLDEADAQAELLLASADALTGALEAASGRRHLQVVNLSGRQRMLAQRLAKQALLAAVLPGPQAAAHAQAAAQTVREFEATLATLEQAPLASDAIRAALAQARGQWQRLLDGLRRSDGADAAAGRATLARESEALVLSFEQLTSLYEHSMQVLLG